MRVLGVSIDLDETTSHWLVYVSPSRELAAQGIAPHRSKLVKCAQTSELCAPNRRTGRCAGCKGRDIMGIALYMRKLLRTYPKIVVTIPPVP